jgi:hypothetical protein
MRLLPGALAAISIALIGFIATAPPVQAAPQANSGQVMTVRQHEFYAEFRKLWEDHITWTRLYIVSAVADLPDKTMTAERLLQNQVDLGNAVKPFYGDAAGDQLSDLLTDHILIAAAIIEAAKASDFEEVENLRIDWYANSDAIANFLSSANPDNWPAEAMREMMRDHLDLTFDEAVAQLTGNYPASVQLYDQVHVQALDMADMLAEGIIAQFPGKFRPGL